LLIYIYEIFAYDILVNTYVYGLLIFLT